MTNQTFNLDLIPQGVPPIVHVSQYDKGQTWEIHLHENGIVFPAPANTSAAIQGTKPDNTGFQFPAVITAGDNVVTFTLEQQMTVFSGDIDCELVLVNGNDQVATINFTLQVEPAALDNETIISETELPLIEQAAQLGAVIDTYAQQIHADAQTAANAVTATAASESNAAASATAAASSASTATQAADDALASQTAAASSESNAATSETNAAASAAAAQAAIATDMTGATASTAGTHGLVPAPSAGDNDKFLGGDGTWKDVPAELRGLSDVVLNNPADGQLLRYDATAQKWKNAGVDSAPTANSTNLVSSGGVKTAIDDISSQISNLANNCMVKKIAETDGDNTAGTNIGWLIQQFWDNLPLEDKLRSAIVINDYILRCSNISQKTFSCSAQYTNGSLHVWKEIIALQGQYIEVSGYAGSTINVSDYSNANVGNAALYVL